MDAISSAGQALVDEQKPSLFELLSEQQLHGLLPPTLRYLLTVATQRYPRYLLRTLNSFDELYALVMAVVEHYYLRNMGGTFTEHFYGLKRERVLEGGSGRSATGVPMRNSSEVPRATTGTPAVVSEFLKVGSNTSLLWKNLAVIVGVPYLKRKLDAAYELDAPRARLGAAYQRLPPNPTLRDRIRHMARWFLRNVYPSVHAAYGFAMLAFNLAYLFDGSRYASPLLWLVSTRVRRMTGADYQAIDAAAERRSTASASSSSIAGRALGGLSMVLPASIFALKFLEWWHASDFAKQLSLKASSNLDLPPPLASGVPTKASAGSATGTGNASSTGSIGRKSILKKETLRRADDAHHSNTEENAVADAPTEEEELARTAPIAKPSLLPIYTVPAPSDSGLCPICAEEITTPTACQTGVVYCYICIHKWVSGQHDKQEAFMADKAGRWESGEGRCAVSGRRVLGGAEGLRRLMV